MSFEKVIVEPCIVKLGSIDPTTGLPVCPGQPPEPPTDPDCNDPAYRLAHPELCDGIQILIIKPGSLTLCSGLGTQFKTFVYANGVEMEVTAGVEYQSSDNSKVQIGVLSGKATAIDGGMATISVSWQGLSAFAQITVVDDDVCCEDTKVGMLVLMDNSKSMKREFGVPYGSRISYAKSLIQNFFASINDEKDFGALMSFTESGKIEQVFTNDLDQLTLKTGALPTTNFGTDIAEGLRDAIDYINADSTFTHKVIILVTDGENNAGHINPRIVADEFVSSGGILITVGIRAYGDGFDILQHMASGGFFLNALPSNGLAVFGFLSGMKGYFCAGNCVPPGDILVPKAYLNYSSFINWDVTGFVDLIGGSPPYELYDVLPDHGLYVDMIGSAPPWYGKLTSKTSYNILANIDYRLKFKLGGNQRANISPQTIRVKVGTLVDEDITVDWKADFTEFTYDFFTAGGELATISFEQILGSTAEEPSFGILLDDVILIREPDGDNEFILYDDFNQENPVYIEPKCGPGTIVIEGAIGYGENCYGEGCLDSPPPAQREDPSPTPDLEGGSNPQIYTCTQSHTASCPNGTSGSDVTGSYTSTSPISQVDACARAKAEAKFLAEGALYCTANFEAGDLFNMHFTGPECDTVIGEGGLQYSKKAGIAATGNKQDDFWNSFFNTPDNRWLDSDRNETTLGFEVSAGGGTWEGFTIDHPDEMYVCGVTEVGTSIIPDRSRFLLTPGVDEDTVFEIYFYGHGDGDDQNTSFNVSVGHFDGVSWVEVTAFSPKSTVNGPGYLADGFLSDVHYVKFGPVAIPSGEQALLYMSNGEAGSAHIQGIQIRRTS